MTDVAESRQRVWTVAAPLVIWSVHFMLCYVTVALWCGPVGGYAPELPLALLVIYTVMALAGILWLAWIGRRAHALGNSPTPHDADSPEDRHRFLGFATLLIAGLSGIAVVYTAMAFAFVRTCQ